MPNFQFKLVLFKNEAIKEISKKGSKQKPEINIKQKQGIKDVD